jgi:NitT/TauT family transport system substrate-binding protein
MVLITGNVRGGEVRYKLTLPGVVSYELNLPTLVAHANGHFAEQGIDLENFVLGSGGTLRTAMIAKEFDFGLFAFVHVPLARIAGSPWKVVIALHDREIFNLLVRSEHRDRVRSVADLRGMRVGFSTPGAGSWYIGSVFLKSAGLDPQKDVQYLSLGGDPGVIYTALRTGRVDAFSAWEPTTTRVLEEGIAYPITRIWEEAEHRRWLGANKALALMLVTREDVIARNPGLVRRMVEAHKKGLETIRSRSTGELADMVLRNPKTAELFSGLDRALVIKIFDRIKAGFGTGCLSRSGFDVEMKLAMEYQLTRRAITFEEFADTRFAGECQ